MKKQDYQIYYIHPQLGEVVVAIIRGKSEAMKRLNQLSKQEPTKYKIKEFN